MKTYEITGWPLENCSSGAEKLLQLTELLSTGADRFCVESHFPDFTTLRAVAQQVPASRFALYGWCNIQDGAVFERTEFNSVNSVRCVFGNRLLEVGEDRDLLPYDWNGLPSGRSVVSYLERYAEPVERENGEPNQQLIQLIERIATATLGEALPARTSTARMGDYRLHSYMVFCSSPEVARLLRAISEQFDLRDGVGSFEFLGSADTLGKILESGLYRLEEFPPGCWSFNHGDGKMPYALERASFLNPVLNLKAVDLPKLAALMDSLGSKIVRCSVIRKYLSWKLANGASPHTCGNYVLLSKQKRGYAFFVGFEQYADGDPSPKEFLSFASKILGQDGVKMKSVPYPR